MPHQVTYRKGPDVCKAHELGYGKVTCLPCLASSAASLSVALGDWKVDTSMILLWDA